MFLKVGDSGGRKPEKGSTQDSAWIPLIVSNVYESAQMKTEEKVDGNIHTKARPCFFSPHDEKR